MKMTGNFNEDVRKIGAVVYDKYGNDAVKVAAKKMSAAASAKDYYAEAVWHEVLDGLASIKTKAVQKSVEADVKEKEIDIDQLMMRGEYEAAARILFKDIFGPLF